MTEKPDVKPAITPGMNEAEIRAAGLAVDVPFESGQSDPERLRYADLGMTWTPPADWPPEATPSNADTTPTPSSQQEVDGAQGA